MDFSLYSIRLSLNDKKPDISGLDKVNKSRSIKNNATVVVIDILIIKFFLNDKKAPG